MAGRRAAAGDKLRTILGFCLIGFANTVLPLIIYSAAYLIIPFPRPVVLLIQTIPAIAVKFLFPHLLRSYIPYWFRPVIISFGWVVSAIVASVTPPNVAVPLRVLTVVLASLQAAAGDVTWLGNLRFYGKLGLVGWGIGTGSGSVVGAVLPYTLTVSMGTFLRSGIHYVYYLVPVMLVSHWFVLPPAPNALDRDENYRNKDDEVDSENEDSMSLLVHDAPAKPLRAMQRIEANFRLLNQLTAPFVVPLLLSFIGYALFYPGFSRASAASASFDRYTSFLAAHGLAFQLGNCISRSSLLFTRYRNTRLLLLIITASATLLLFNTLFAITSASILVLPLVFIAGLAAGGVYIDLFASLVEEKGFESGADREFSYMAVGVGEPAGLLLGGLIATVLEQWLCASTLASGHRWCHTTW